MKWITRILGGTVALFGAAAFAGDPPTPPSEPDCAPAAFQEPMPTTTPPPPPAKHADAARITGFGIDLETGGGVGGFLDSRAAAVTGEQGQWTVRGVIGTRRHFAGEVAYVGSAQNVYALGVDPNASLIGGGIEGAARFNLLTGAWQPYAVGGIGWNHYSLMGTTLNTSSVASNTDVMTFPLGAGLAYRVNGLVLDARLSFHPAVGSQVIPDASLSTWDLNGKVGFEF